LLQITFSQNPPFICGSFILISELLKTKKNIFQFDHSLLYSNQIGAEKESDDEEERFFDVKSDGESGEEEKEEPNKKNEKPNKAAGSWQHNKNVIFKKHVKYDFHERNPLYAGADKTLTYELLPFTRHYHPTVVVFANKLMNVVIFKI
jgi:ribosome biogenesis protein MAK21